MISSSSLKYLVFLLLSTCNGIVKSPVSHAAAPPRIPSGVTFHTDTLFRSKGHGDNWCLTWAADDSLITAMCDGNWLGGEHSYHAHLYRITGGPENFGIRDIPGYPQFVWKTGSWFGYGVVSVGGLLYATVSKTPANHWSGPFRGLKILKSPDNGKTWYRLNRQGKERAIDSRSAARNDVTPEEMFFLEEQGRKGLWMVLVAAVHRVE